ncbi:VWA domain-containing protein, partial [Streptomyces sp. NPDC001020]
LTEAPGSEPEVAKAPEPETTPAVAPEPEAAKAPEPEPTVKATPEREPAVEATLVEATPEPEPEPQAEEPTQSQPEPQAEPATAEEPADTPADTPAAADDEKTPQESPDGAHEDGTAEGEAEEDTRATGPAVTLAHVTSRAPGLTTAYKAAATVLDQHGLTGTRAKVYLVLDRSASMRPYYKDGSAQALGEQALALAAHLDPEATVQVVFFSTELDGTGELTLAEHENKIDDLHSALGRMGRTSYHAAVEAVVTHHEKSADPALPALVIFQTDGAPDTKTPATQSLTATAKDHPAVFFSFVAFGDPEHKAFDYLRKLKTDNAAHFLAGETPRELTDTEVYQGVLANWRP